MTSATLLALDAHRLRADFAVFDELVDGRPVAFLDSAASTQKPRQVLEALSGLLLGMFVSMLASTVVSTSLPVIVHDLEGDQNAFTWVVTATARALGVDSDTVKKKLVVVER